MTVHEEHERKVLLELRDLPFEPDGRSRAHAVGYLGNRVEEARLGASRSEGAREVTLVYRDLPSRPRRSLGWRMPRERAIGATVLWADFMEHTEASVRACQRTAQAITEGVSRVQRTLGKHSRR